MLAFLNSPLFSTKYRWGNVDAGKRNERIYGKKDNQGVLTDVSHLDSEFDDLNLGD